MANRRPSQNQEGAQWASNPQALVEHLDKEQVKSTTWGRQSGQLEFAFRDYLNKKITVLPNPIAANPKAPTVCMLSEACERVAFITEGGRQSCGNVLLCISASWLARGTQDPTELYCYRGVWCDEAGNPFMGTFYPPRRVTYFANFLTKNCTEGVDVSGEVLEGGRATGLPHLGMPMSSSIEIEQFIGDKLHTRVLAALSHVAVPRCVAFMYKPNHTEQKYKGIDRLKNVLRRTVWNDKSAATSTETIKFIEEWCRDLSDEGCRRVVVKPSGPCWMDGEEVSFVSTNAPAEVAQKVANIAEKIVEGDSILIDEYCSAVQPLDVITDRELLLEAVLNPSFASETATLSDALEAMNIAQKVESEEKSATSLIGATLDLQVCLSFIVRSMVQRTRTGSVCSAMIAIIGQADTPLRGRNTTPTTLEQTLFQWGMSEKQVDDVIDAVRKESESVFNGIAKFEKTLNASERGGRLAQTDNIGIDFILCPRGGAIVPVAIEVNDHDSTNHGQRLETILSTEKGACVRPWVTTALMRSLDYMVDGMRLVVIGGGCFSKRFIWGVAKKAGIKVVLVDHDPNHWAKISGSVEDLVAVEGLDDHSRDAEHVTNVVAALKKAGYTPENIDGCMTFWEDCGPLSAMISERLGMNRNEVKAHLAAKCKSATQNALMQQDTPYPIAFRMNQKRYANPMYNITSEDDLEETMKNVSMPAVLKADYGSSAVGVVMVKDPEMCRREYRRLRKALGSEDAHPGSGLSFSPGAMSICNFLDGSEHDVDVVMYHGELVFAAVADNGPTRLPYFCETTACMPSALHPHQRQALITAARTCCRALGLNTGTFNCEFKFTTGGPKLIEINARMGGFYIHDWIMRVYGVSYCLSSMLCAMDIKPFVPPMHNQPKASRANPTVICGMQIYTSLHGKRLRGGLLDHLKVLHDRKVIVFNQFEETVEEHAEEFEEPVGNVAVTGKTMEEAKATLLTLVNMLDLDRGAVPDSWFIKHL